MLRLGSLDLTTGLKEGLRGGVGEGGREGGREGGIEGGRYDGERKESEEGVTIQWSSSKSLVLPVKGGTQVNMCYSQASATVCIRNKNCSGGLGDEARAVQVLTISSCATISACCLFSSLLCWRVLMAACRAACIFAALLCSCSAVLCSCTSA